MVMVILKMIMITILITIMIIPCFLASFLHTPLPVLIPSTSTPPFTSLHLVPVPVPRPPSLSLAIYLPLPIFLSASLQLGATSTETLANLNGAWRLIFTTGTIDTQKKLGRKINYFPLKAAQCFYTDSMTLTNGIFLGDFELIKFFGEFEW